MKVLETNCEPLTLQVTCFNIPSVLFMLAHSVTIIQAYLSDNWAYIFIVKICYSHCYTGHSTSPLMDWHADGKNKTLLSLYQLATIKCTEIWPANFIIKYICYLHCYNAYTSQSHRVLLQRVDSWAILNQSVATQFPILHQCHICKKHVLCSTIYDYYTTQKECLQLLITAMCDTCCRSFSIVGS